jgi:integrase
MRGHIVKRYKDSYTIVLNLGPDPQTGKRKQQWVSVKGTKKDAEKRLAELLHQLDTGSFMKPGKTTVADFLQRWLQDYCKPNLSPRGYERYESVSRVHLIPALGHVPLTALKPEHLQRLYTAKLNSGLAARTVRYQHVILHKTLETAMKWGLVARNVADGVDVPRARRTEIQTWDEGEVACFLEAAKGSPYYALFYTNLFTGMRRSELLALRWQDIDFLYSQVSVSRGLHHLVDGSYVFTQPKSVKSRRTISLTPSTSLLLQEHKAKKEFDHRMLGILSQDSDLVFSTPDGKPLRPNTVSRAWASLAARCGVKVISFHAGRHTHASLLLRQNVHPKIVQERLGHSSIAVTLDTYSHVAPGLQEAAAQKFDDIIKLGHNNAVESIR